MKKISTSILALCHVIAAGAAVAAMVSTASFAAEPPPSDAPPKMSPLDEGDPAVTNQKKDKASQIESTSQTGQQTEVKVSNGIGTYIVKPNQHIGTSLPGDAQSTSNNPVQWVVKSWGGSKNTEPVDETPPTLQPNSSPPANK